MTFARQAASSDEGSPAGSARVLPRLCLVTTVPVVIQRFLTSHLRLLSERFDVTIVANGDCSALVAGMPRPVQVFHAPIERKISLPSDVRALGELVLLMRRERFDAVVTVAPKAGLIGILAAAMTRVPYRCHVFQGEVWATRKGLMRTMLRSMDWLVGRLATETLVVSNGERQYLIGEGLLSAEHSHVLGAGSISGVDTRRFAPDLERRRSFRAEKGIGTGETLILYVGRLQNDKGVMDLVAAWKALALASDDISLAIVGPDEDDLTAQIIAAVPETLASRLHLAKETPAPEDWMKAADILCLPSYREGFGTVLIEAAACGLPTVSTRIYGLADSVVDGETGLVYAPGDVEGLRQCLARLAGDDALRQRQGAAGRAMAVANFEHDVVVKRYVDHWAARCRGETDL